MKKKIEKNYINQLNNRAFPPIQQNNYRFNEFLYGVVGYAVIKKAN